MQSALCNLLTLYWVALLGRILVSWFPITPGSFLAQVAGLLHTITEPVLGPVRRLMGPMRIGGVGIDFSATIVLIAWQLVLMPLVGC